MTDKLAKVEAGLAKRLDPKIETTAKPEVDWLLQGRADVNSDEGIRAIFQRAKDDGKSPDWLADQVATRFMAKWDQPGQAAKVAQYLADEHFQIGDGIQIVSTDTGRILITLTEDDIYQPEMLPRESGRMAKPLPRLNPALEAFLTIHTHDGYREEKILRTLVERQSRAIMLDDPRLDPATRRGRTQIVRDVSETSPETLLRGLGGSSAAFLQHFDLRTTPPEDDRHVLIHGAEPDLDGTIEARSVLRIGDQTTINVHHDRRAALRGVLPQGWVREMARLLADGAHKRGCDLSYAVSQISTVRQMKVPTALWVIPPEAVRAFVQPGWAILPVENTKVIGLTKPKVGTIVIPTQMLAASHELFERWEAVADLDFKMWVDWEAIICLNITGLEYPAHVV